VWSNLRPALLIWYFIGWTEETHGKVVHIRMMKKIINLFGQKTSRDDTGKNRCGREVKNLMSQNNNYMRVNGN
jgi:hypothetical protein